MPTQNEIERRAYELYEQRGREDGHDHDDWLLAEAQLRTAEAEAKPSSVKDRGPAPQPRRTDAEARCVVTA